MMVYSEAIWKEMQQTYLHLDISTDHARIRLNPQVDRLQSLILCDGRQISSPDIPSTQGSHLLAYELQDYSGRVLESREIRFMVPAPVSQTLTGTSEYFLFEHEKNNTESDASAESDKKTKTEDESLSEQDADTEEDSENEYSGHKENKSEESVEEGRIEIAEPFRHSGAVILASKQMDLKFQKQPENCVLWIEENGEKRIIELNEKEITISLKEDLVRAYLQDDQGNILKKWSILCLDHDENLHADPALNLKEYEQEEDSSLSQEDSSSPQPIEPIPEPVFITSQTEGQQEEPDLNADSQASEDPSPTEIPDEPSEPVEGADSADTPEPALPQEPEEEAVADAQPASSRPDIWAPEQVAPSELDQIRTNTIPIIPPISEKPQIQLVANQKRIDAGKSLYTRDLADLELGLTNGTMQSVEIHSLDTGQFYLSFKEASTSEPSGTFEVIAKYFDLSQQPHQARWTVVGIGEPVAATAAAQGRQVDTVYQVDEQGKLKAQSQSQEQKMQLYRGFEPIEAGTVQSGEELRLYLDKEPGIYEMEINGKKTEVEIRKDELGQPYLPVQPQKGTSTIQLFKNGEEVFSQDIVAHSRSHFWTLTVATAVLVLLIGAGVLFFRRHHQAYA